MTNSNGDHDARLLRHGRQTLCRYAKASDLSRTQRYHPRPCHYSWEPFLPGNGNEVAATTPLPEESAAPRNSGRISQHVTAAYATVSNRVKPMSLKDLIIGAIAATAVVGAVIATPILLKSPVPPKPLVLKADKEPVIQPEIRTIPLTKPPPPEECPTNIACAKDRPANFFPKAPDEPVSGKPANENDNKPELVPAPLVKEETEVELPARRHYGDGSDICRRTGGWKVSTGRGWRCRYRR